MRTAARRQRRKGRLLHASFVAVCGLFLSLLSFPSPASAQSGTALRSVNYPDHFIRHQNFRGKITPVRSDLDHRDATFIVRRPGLAGRGISFESANFPGHFLRHRNFEVWLDRNDGSELFRLDATFTEVRGLAGGGGTSFQSVNYPDRYLRHRNFLLWLEGGNSDLFRKDATFHLTVLSR